MLATMISVAFFLRRETMAGITRRFPGPSVALFKHRE